MIEKIINEIRNIKNNTKLDIKEETPLIGDSSKLDSMELVKLCLWMEEQAEGLGFEFDWSSENAMSKTKSIFRNVKSLSTEFENQRNNK